LSLHGNNLIERLPRRERLHLLAHSESVSLTPSDILSEPGQSSRYVYFPTEGMVSLITTIDGGHGIEVGMIGHEGMLGVQAVLELNAAPLYGVVQGKGSAWRTEISLFQLELVRCTALRRSMQAYMFFLIMQLATSSACLHFHLISQRLARWLLMRQDRTCDDHFYITHEFLAYFLGVRRASITSAASEMQKSGLIEYCRGNIIVLDRTGLLATACSCYAADKIAYAQFLEHGCTSQ